MSNFITHNMLKTIITSETRIKLLLKFFLNPTTSGYLRQLAKDFGESTNSIRLELNKLSDAKILSSNFEGRNKIFRANSNHPLFDDIRSIVLKSTGMDRVVTNIIHKVGKLHTAFVRGDYAVGKDSGLIDLVIVGENINTSEVNRVKTKTEKLINRKIAVLILNAEEYQKLNHNFISEPILTLYSDKNKIMDNSYNDGGMKK
jgi:hypothetical protein